LAIKGGKIIERHIDISEAVDFVEYHDFRHERHLSSSTSGEKTITVVRVSTIDSVPSYSAQEMQDRLFGQNIGLQTQYFACSFGQLIWKLSPAGVIDIMIDDSVTNYNTGTSLVSAATEYMKNVMGINSPSELSDKVMYCLPPGTGTWAASAAVNHWRAQFNDKWCLSLTATMHEIGHTIGLLHSNENGVPYGDSTGYMSAGHLQQEWPRKCFNSVNNWHLGWYSERSVTVNPLIDGSVYYALASFVDYPKASESEPVLVNIADVYFLQYNDAKDFNVDTEEKQNLVLVTEDLGGSTDAKAGLDVSNRFEAPNFQNSGRTLIIEVCSKAVGNENSPDIIYVSIAMDISLCSSTTAIASFPTAAPTMYNYPLPGIWPTISPTPATAIVTSVTTPPTSVPNGSFSGTASPTIGTSTLSPSKPSLSDLYPTSSPTNLQYIFGSKPTLRIKRESEFFALTGATNPDLDKQKQGSGQSNLIGSLASNAASNQRQPDRKETIATTIFSQSAIHKGPPAAAKQATTSKSHAASNLLDIFTTTSKTNDNSSAQKADDKSVSFGSVFGVNTQATNNLFDKNQSTNDPKHKIRIRGTNR
jgi:hypothetical protein